MPLYLADTSAWNRSTAVAERWGELFEANQIATCLPVKLELLYSARDREEFESLRIDLAALPYLSCDARAEAIAGRAQQALAARAQHRGPKPMDLLVAAIARAHGAVVLHYDRHFDVLARLTGQAAEWLAPRGSLA